MPLPIRNRRRLNGLSTASFATSANSLHVRGSEFADQPLQGLPTPPFDPRWGGGLQPGNASPGLPSDLPSSGGGSCGRRCLRSTLCAGSFDYVHCGRVPAPLRHRGRRAASATPVQPHRRGLVVNDLHRHPLSLPAVDWGTRLLSRSSMVRHDGPLCVRRGFRREELGDLAGFTWHLVDRRWAFRFVATALR